MQTQDNEALSSREAAADLRAAVAARRELSPEFEDHLIEAFLARVEQRIDARVEQQLAQNARPARSGRGPVQVEIIAGSFALAIPLIAIAGGIAGTIGILAVALALIAVNLFYFIDRWSQ